MAPAGTLQHLTPDVQGALRTQLQRARDDTLETMLVASLIMLGVGVVAGGFGWLLAGRALHPLQQITATSRRVADRSLHERIALDGPDDEIKDLADTVDSMSNGWTVRSTASTGSSPTPPTSCAHRSRSTAR